MSPERWQQIEEIFQNALDLSPSEREHYVVEKCADDSELKSEVEKLLSQFEDASSFIETPALSDEKVGVLSSLMEFDEDDPMIGNVLGSYRIEREIGRGGMGAVYEAIRADGEFRRKVAIKIVKRGMDTDFILRRFRNERQILATLDHPYITRLLDGGTTDDSRPYFVMDYIEGFQLYRFCDKNRLTITERLKLFIKICEAVEYAHQNLVIHRDLKPSNILVVSDETPRLLDFGIAKLLNPEMALDTLQPTATAMRMMTIDYASPEQINGEKVTFATDIYSLGVILFELLTGHRPYRFPSRTPHEAARVICEEPPSLPSNAIIRSENTLPIIQVDQEALTIRHLAELRKNSPDNLQKELRGNLDNITLKALRKLPEDRYESIKKFREDIEKHLDGKPISAPFYFPTSKKETPQTVHNGRLIAVLPLKLLNFSPTENTDENYLSIGLADAIISRLTNVRDFTVRPTSSISGYEKSETDAMQAGKELGVDFVLEGRIRKFGNKLRVSLQMLDVIKGSTVWAGQFDEEFSDVLSLEDAISEQVAEALVTQITGENNVKLGKRGTDNPKAYEAYLKGRFYWSQFTADSLQKAIEFFQKAVERDPNYALAHVGIADFYIWANIYGLIPSLESTNLAEDAINKALAIDNQLGEAYTTLGLIKHNQFNWKEGKRLHQKAIELNPNYSHAHEWYSANLVGTGNFAEGLMEIKRCEELDPLSLRTKTLVAWTKCQAQQFEEALAKAEEIINLDSNFPQGHLQKGYVLIELGRGEEAVAEIEKAMSLMPESSLLKFNLAFAFAAANRRDDARKVFNEMKSDAKKFYVKPMFLGFAAVAAEEINEAFDYLNQGADEFDPWLVWLGTDLKLEPIRKDKRYLELMRRTKNPMLKHFSENQADAEESSIAIKPFEKADDTIHQSQIETKIFTADEIKLTKKDLISPTFFQRHKYKFAFAGVLLILISIGMATGVITFDFQDRRVGLETKNASIIKKSVAILPFKNETANPENDFLCDGLSENIITHLMNSSDIQVVPRSTSFKYKDKQIEPRAAGAEMNVESVLSGKITKHDDKIDIFVELTDVKDGSQIWTFYYSRPDTELIALQNQMANDIANQFKPNSSEQKQTPSKSFTENTEAFEFYLKGEYHRQKATPEDMRKSVEFYKKALELDPNFALAYQGLAMAYRSSPAYGTLSPNEAYPLAKEYAIKALAIDPALSSAHVPLASIKYVFDWDFAGAEKEYKQAIELTPNNADAHFSYGNFLVAMGRTDEALVQMRIAQQFDPLSANTATNIGWALYVAGRFDEAETQIKQVIAREPTFARAYMNLGEIYQEEGKFDEAIANFQKSKQLSNDVLADMALGHAYAMAGRKADALKIATDLEAKVLKKEVSPFLPGVVYAGLNEKDKSFYWLERAFQERSNWLTLAKVGRRLKSLHGDPRFDDLLKRIGFDE